MRLDLGILRLVRSIRREYLGKHAVGNSGVEINNNNIGNEANSNNGGKIVCTYVANSMICYRRLENGLIEVL
ncbi:MAG: hypothetical protein QW348_02855 [Ignisphaera sp.]